MAEQAESDYAFTPLSRESAERAADLLVAWMTTEDEARGAPLSSERAGLWRQYLADGFASADHPPEVLERLTREAQGDIVVVRTRAALAYAASHMFIDHTISSRPMANTEE